MSETSRRVKMACVWKLFAYVFIFKTINQVKILVLDLYLQSNKIQNLIQVNMKENKYFMILFFSGCLGSVLPGA